MRFEEFVAARQVSLLRFAMVLSGDARRAEEIVQAVLVRAYERWDRIGPMDASGGYVRRMVLNEFLTWRRRSRRLVPLDAAVHDIAVHDVGSADSTDALADRAELVAELTLLPPRQRAVLVLRYYEGHTDTEIADLLGCSVSTVRSQASRALARLRIQLPAPYHPLGTP